MRAPSIATVASLLLLAAGCASVRHDFQPYRAAGADLPIEVAVRYQDGDLLRGTVHHRREGAGPFEATPMTLRADQLYAILPTHDTRPNDIVEYYIDVSRNGELLPLGSPGQPYMVTFLDGDQMILARLRDQPVHTDAHHDVRIELLTDGQRIEQPEVVYQMPGVPGSIRANMEPDAKGNFALVVPPDLVTPGTWRYKIEVPVNGTTYQFPKHGYRNFIVDQGYPPKIATGAVK